MPPSHCPICQRPAAPRPQNRAFPFCTERCRMVDLGRWLGEDYAIPGPPADPDSLPPPRPDPEA